MARKNVPGYLLHKPSKQAIVVLNGKTIYLGKYKSKASREEEEYEKVIADYLANGKKLPPSRGNGAGISIEEMAIHFLESAESYYVKNGKQTDTFTHCRLSLSPADSYLKTEKYTILDVRATDERGDIFVVEFQTSERKTFADRMTYYGCRSFGNQIRHQVI